MTRVLVTGGAGVLGRAVVSRLAKQGSSTVRVMSRSAAKSGNLSGVEWARADLESGTGLKEAVAGVDVIVHAASNSRGNTYEADVAGTQRLLEQAKAAGVEHLLYISIVGIERVPLGYYKIKIEAEKAVQAGGVPWSILRATQFHPFIDFVARALARLPIMFVPNFVAQPIDPGEVADRIVEQVATLSVGYLPDIGGPEILHARDIARSWRAARGLHQPILPLPLFGKVAAGYRSGYHTTPNRYGKITWADWLRTTYQQQSSTRPSEYTVRV